MASQEWSAWTTVWFKTAGTAIENKPDLVVTDLKIDRMASWDPETLKYIWVSLENIRKIEVGGVAGTE